MNRCSWCNLDNPKYIGYHDNEWGIISHDDKYLYEMLNIPRDLFIPLFSAARLVGWVSHDIENLLYSNKIVRPATKYVGEKK